MFVLEQFKQLPTQQHLDTQLAQINEETDKIAQKTDQNATNIAEMDKRLREVEKMESRPAARRDSTTKEAQTNFEEEFDKASRSIRFWPITGNDATELNRALDEFLKDALMMEGCHLRSIIVEDVYRVASGIRSRQHNEIVAVFRDVDMRMLVLSYARNLATYVDTERKPTAGMRMEIPRQLQATYKLLDAYGFSIQERHDKQTRRFIKFDYIARSLFLAYKLPNSETWHNITPAMAKSTGKEKLRGSWRPTLEH